MTLHIFRYTFLLMCFVIGNEFITKSNILLTIWTILLSVIISATVKMCQNSCSSREKKSSFSVKLEVFTLISAWGEQKGLVNHDPYIWCRHLLNAFIVFPNHFSNEWISKWKNNWIFQMTNVANKYSNNIQTNELRKSNINIWKSTNRNVNV